MSKISRDELRLAAYLLRMVGDQFSNHGCNDMPEDAFACISEESRAAMAQRFNEYNGSTNPDALIPFSCIGDSSWMHHLSALCLLEAERHPEIVGDQER